MSLAILRPESHAGDTHRSMSAGGASFELVVFPCRSIANVAASEFWSVAVHMCERAEGDIEDGSFLTACV